MVLYDACSADFGRYPCRLSACAAQAGVVDFGIVRQTPSLLKYSDYHPHMAIVNRRARHEYHILETYEAGIILTGPEVKSIRSGLANLAEAHCIIRKGQLLLIGCHISPYKPAARNNPKEPARSRQLLLHKKELQRLLGKLKEKGLTLVPLKLYFNVRNYAKLEIGLARGKKMYDKRQDKKERDVKRDLQRRYKM